MSAAPKRGALIDRFRRARRDRTLAVVEGFHALKHALRFDAEIVEALCADDEGLQRLVTSLAPDLRERLSEIVRPIDAQTLSEIAPRATRTGVIALARRRSYDEKSVLANPRPSPIVLLEEPRDSGNVGACIRVAAAADAAGVIVTGRHDPWHPDAIRGAAGLHFALPVLWLHDPSACYGLPACDRPLIAMDPEGDPLDSGALPERAIVAFGSERQGLSSALIAAADSRVRIPMKEGVSSLNLATSVAATLFGSSLRGSA